MGRSLEAEIVYGFELADEYGDWSEPDWFNGYLLHGLPSTLDTNPVGSLYVGGATTLITIKDAGVNVYWGAKNIDEFIYNPPQLEIEKVNDLKTARNYIRDELAKEDRHDEISEIGWHLLVLEG